MCCVQGSCQSNQRTGYNYCQIPKVKNIFASHAVFLRIYWRFSPPNKRIKLRKREKGTENAIEMRMKWNARLRMSGEPKNTSLLGSQSIGLRAVHKGQGSWASNSFTSRIKGLDADEVLTSAPATFSLDQQRMLMTHALRKVLFPQTSKTFQTSLSCVNFESENTKQATQLCSHKIPQSTSIYSRQSSAMLSSMAHNSSLWTLPSKTPSQFREPPSGVWPATISGGTVPSSTVRFVYY